VILKKIKSMERGAVVRCLARLLHPSQLIREKFPNMNRSKRLDLLIVIWQETKKILRKEHMCIIVQSDEAMDGDVHLELCGALKQFKIKTEGLVENFFHLAVEAEINEQGEDRTVGRDLLPTEVLDNVNFTVLDDEYVALVSGAVETDNHNDPLPENVPTANDNVKYVYATSWGHSGLCNCRMAGASNAGPERNFPILFCPTLLDNLELYFPRDFITDTIISIMNRHVKLRVVQ
jgi:hypothetical protein